MKDVLVNERLHGSYKKEKQRGGGRRERREMERANNERVNEKRRMREP